MKPKPKPAAGLTQVTAVNDRNKTVQVSGRKFHSREDLYTQPDYGDMFSNLTAVCHQN